MGMVVDDWAAAGEINSVGNRPDTRQNIGIRFVLGRKKENQLPHRKKAGLGIAVPNLISPLNKQYLCRFNLPGREINTNFPSSSIKSGRGRQKRGAAQ
ncbi:MAG: hypothetical protein ACLQAH_03240 [Limisphaerales bacterium]